MHEFKVLIFTLFITITVSYCVLDGIFEITMIIQADIVVEGCH